MTTDETTLDYRLLQNGCVVLYHSPFLIEEHSSLLVRSGWQFKKVYVGQTGTEEEFYEHIASALEFPDYFGRNLDAFRDCMRDIAFPAGGRLALGLMNFEIVARRDGRLAHKFLDIFAESERSTLMDGKRVLFMVQSNDPDLYFSAVGAHPVFWNFEGWLDANRKKKH